MKQAELNRQVAKQLGEAICEIARRGFSLVEDVPDESTRPQLHQDKAVTTVVAA
jgi:hypothetical protein